MHLQPANTPAIDEPARSTPVYAEVDVVVLGGGPAGIAAAAASARRGARTLLVERYGFLGGMGTAAGVTNFCGLHANVYGEIRRVVHGVADELLDRMRALGGLSEPHLIFGKIHAQAYDTAAFKCAADAQLLACGAELLFHALAVGVTRRAENGAIDTLLLETKSGRGAVRARAFVDCSGDGDLAHHTGVPMEKADAAGEFHFPRRGAIVRPQQHAYEWRVNVTQLKNADGSATDGTDARSLSAAEVEGRRQAIDFLRF